MTGTSTGRRLARLNGTSWKELGSGVDDTVLGLAAIPDGVAVAGRFDATGAGTELGGLGLWTAAGWRRSGSSSGRIGAGIDTYDVVTSVASGSASGNASSQVVFGLAYASVTIPAAELVSPVAAAYLLPATPPPAVPAAPTVTGGGSRRPAVSGNAIGMSLVTIFVDDAQLGTAVPAGDGSWTWTPPSDLDRGWHSLTVTVTDAAGAQSPASPPTLYRVKGRRIRMQILPGLSWSVINPDDAYATMPEAGQQDHLLEPEQDAVLQVQAAPPL